MRTCPIDSVPRPSPQGAGNDPTSKREAHLESTPDIIWSLLGTVVAIAAGLALLFREVCRWQSPHHDNAVDPDETAGTVRRGRHRAEGP